MSFTVRKALKHDMVAIRDMIQELADFEKMSHEPQLKVEDLYRDGGFLDDENKNRPLFLAFIAEDRSNETAPKTVGYALCFNSYSTWQGKVFFMEDLYVRPAYRKLGIGKLIVGAVVQHAKETNCCRCEFHVLDWNPARDFYKRIGAVDLSAAEGWLFYRLDRKAMESFQ